jgi:hypothetical protein
VAGSSSGSKVSTIHKQMCSRHEFELSTKVDAARAKGVEIWTEAQFLAAILGSPKGKAKGKVAAFPAAAKGKVKGKAAAPSSAPSAPPAPAAAKGSMRKAAAAVEYGARETSGRSASIAAGLSDRRVATATDAEAELAVADDDGGVGVAVGYLREAEAAMATGSEGAEGGAGENAALSGVQQLSAEVCGSMGEYDSYSKKTLSPMPQQRSA